LDLLSFLLMWVLIGSIATNFLWIYREFERDTDINMYHYCKGIVYGLILGPVSVLYVFKKGLDLMNKADRNG